MQGSGVAKGEAGRAQASRLLCPATEIEKDRDTLIEQSDILIKQFSRPGCALSLAMPLVQGIIL